MRMLLLLFGHRITQVLFQERGFDVCILKAVLVGQCKNDEILALTNELLDRLPCNEKVKLYYDFIKQARTIDEKKIKYLFDSEVFYPTLIILAETKVILVREITDAINQHEKKLASTDQEVLFDYSSIELQLPENNTFFKIGGYYIEVLILRPEYLRNIDLKTFNAELMQIITVGGFTVDVQIKIKLLYILLLEMQAAVCDQETLNVLFGLILTCSFILDHRHDSG